MPKKGKNDMADKRSIMRIQIDASAKDELDKICSKRGMTQIAMMSRIVGWFIRQDDVIQSAVLSTLSDQALANLSKQLLKKMAAR
jgi:hypothetical protein